jgi:hypothetical protein
MEIEIVGEKRRVRKRVREIENREGIRKERF